MNFQQDVMNTRAEFFEKHLEEITFLMTFIQSKSWSQELETDEILLREVNVLMNEEVEAQKQLKILKMKLSSLKIISSCRNSWATKSVRERRRQARSIA